MPLERLSQEGLQLQGLLRWKCESKASLDNLERLPQNQKLQAAGECSSTVDAYLAGVRPWDQFLGLKKKKNWLKMKDILTLCSLSSSPSGLPRLPVNTISTISIPVLCYRSPKVICHNEQAGTEVSMTPGHQITALVQGCRARWGCPCTLPCPQTRKHTFFSCHAPWLNESFSKQDGKEVIKKHVSAPQLLKLC